MEAVPRLVRVAAAGEIPVGRGKTVEVDGLFLAVYNTGNGRYRAVSGSCPHEGGPLGEGVLVGSRIICPWHGFDFDVATGRCAASPDLSVVVYPVREAGADVVVELV
jgi:nitrite reductase/ring-hydroxylating ferredoxin subunit